MRHLFVQPQGEKEYDLTARLPSVVLLDMKSSAPQLTGNFLQIAGSDGEALISSNYNPTTVTVSLFLKGQSMADLRALIAEVQSAFYQRRLIRLRSSLTPHRAYWVIGQPTDITPIQGTTQATVDLVFTNPSGMAQSAVRSDELPAKVGALGIGQGIPVDDLTYQQRGGSFKIYNPSDIAIDPYIQHHDLVISVTGVGSSFTITNKTNNTSINVTSPIRDGQTFKLNGVVPSIDGDTNIQSDFGHIELAKGYNDIQVSGLNNPVTTFSFPFLYF